MDFAKELQYAEKTVLAERFQRDALMAYLCSSVAWVSMPGDAVHFTNLAFGESPHSTVPFSSGEAICNNTPGIETMEREEIPAVASSGKKKEGGKKSPHRNLTRGGSDAAGIHCLPFTWTWRQVSHGAPECSAGTMRALWKGTIRTTIRVTDIVGKLPCCVCGSSAPWDKRVFEGNVWGITTGAGPLCPWMVLRGQKLIVSFYSVCEINGTL